MASGGVFTMATKHLHSRPLTQVECDAIVAHLQIHVDGHKQTIDDLIAADPTSQNGWVVQQTHYNRNAIAALSHAISTAKQRTAGYVNG